ncbi:IDEAL domain-containing protein [Neobacillus drentensis]|uniref:IDEAL domain-containing protein n=1 Tax=Neobacillus drentensis TaxID=220684 RepID=UPI001F3BA980|nr:IDEAL domain-containing protein [Neobacillus drentensis]ULT57652.1 IDEAL domain-containing protein [Neobacillus drentensis]
MLLQTGDWIKGTLRDGELIMGYIESLDTSGIVRVNVVTSDNHEVIGKKVTMLGERVKRLPVSNVSNKAQIQFLIDLALSTGDEEWFIELTSKLNAMKQLLNQ